MGTLNMKIMGNIPEITFDDVLLLPQKSSFPLEQEKDHISLKTKVSRNISIDIPIVSSPMPGVTEAEMAIAMAEAGGIGFIHNFQSYERQLEQIKQVKNKKLLVGATIGEQSEKTIKYVEQMLNLGTDLFLVFTYHAQDTDTFKFIKKLKKKFPKIQLNAGNVVTKQAVTNLVSAGIDGIHVGIGPGSHCTTRIVTGIGRPQLSAVQECALAAKKSKTPIIADGGVKYPGDITKALVFGASAVMLGGMLSGSEEAPGEIVKKNGKLYKASWGMCSNTAMTLQHLQIQTMIENAVNFTKHQLKKHLFIEKYKKSYVPNTTFFEEGIEGMIEYKGTVSRILTELTDATRRSLWYQGATDIPKVQKKAKVVLTSQNTTVENKPRI